MKASNGFKAVFSAFALMAICLVGFSRPATAQTPWMSADSPVAFELTDVTRTGNTFASGSVVSANVVGHSGTGAYQFIKSKMWMHFVFHYHYNYRSGMNWAPSGPHTSGVYDFALQGGDYQYSETIPGSNSDFSANTNIFDCAFDFGAYFNGLSAFQNTPYQTFFLDGVDVTFQFGSSVGHGLSPEYLDASTGAYGDVYNGGIMSW